jgi:hypothetical protein
VAILPTWRASLGSGIELFGKKLFSEKPVILNSLWVSER